MSEDQWWNRRAPGEGLKTQMDLETGEITQYEHEHLWLAPFRGVFDLVSDIANRRMSTADWIFLWFVMVLILRGA